MQRGPAFLLSKLNPSSQSRTKSAFDDSAIHSANWWIVPAVRQRWNRLITGDVNRLYEDYLVEEYLPHKKGLRLISIGSGECSHELRLASHQCFSEVVCVDIADNLIATARQKAADQGLEDKMTFRIENVYQMEVDPATFDVVLFHASLHHFAEIDTLLQTVKKWLSADGLLVINEYVGPDRLQFPQDQVEAINTALQTIPRHLRKRYKTGLFKKRFYGSGYLRMVMADPSECVESSTILPLLHRHYDVVIERPYGGNLLMNVLKDIAHHFTDHEDETIKTTLARLFALEDQYLQDHESDFLLGVYQ